MGKEVVISWTMTGLPSRTYTDKITLVDFKGDKPPEALYTKAVELVAEQLLSIYRYYPLDNNEYVEQSMARIKRGIKAFNERPKIPEAGPTE
jgi:hypothetical protein